jgi:hypothetical protein
MEDLRQISLVFTSSEVTQEWLATQVALLADLTWRARLTKKERTYLHEVARQIGAELDEANKLALSEVFKPFRSQSGELLKLYKSLGLAPNISVLARLLHQHWQDGGSTKGIAKHLFPDISLESQEFPHEAVLLWGNADTRRVLAYLRTAVLDDKVDSSPRVLEFYRDVLKSLSVEEFTELLLPTVQRQLKRSPLLIEHCTSLLSFLQTDLSSVQLYFPAVHDHLLRPETRPRALKLLQALVSKTRDQTELIASVTALRPTAEQDIVGCLTALKTCSTTHPMIVRFCLDVSPRLRADEAKTVLYECLGRHLKELTPEVEDFLQTHCTHALVATLYSSFQGSPFQVPAKLNTLQLACVSSVHPTPAFTALCRNPDSAVFTLPHLTSSEELCLARAFRKVLDLEQSPNVLASFGARLLSPSAEVRRFVKDSWIERTEVVGGVAAAAKTETGRRVLEDSFKQTIAFLAHRAINPDHRFLVLQVIAAVFSRARVRWTFKRHPVLFNSCAEWLFISDELDVMLVATGQAESYLQASSAFLSLQTYEHIEYLTHELDIAPEEPSTKELSDITSLAQVSILDLEQVPPSQMRSAWTDKLAKSTLKLATVASGRLSVLSRASLLAKYMGVPHFVLPWALQIENVLQLQRKQVLNSASNEAVRNLLLASPQLSERASDFNAALRRSVNEGWSEKLAEGLLEFAEARLDVSKLTPSEVNTIEVFLRWVLRQPASGVRQHGLALLTRLVQAHKFSSLVKTLALVCSLLRNYSPPALAKLFPPILDLVEPLEWRPLFSLLLELQFTAKKIVLDALDQYPHTLPADPWCVAPLLVLTHDESKEVVRDSHHVLHKFKLTSTLQVLLEGVVPLLLNSHEDGQRSAAASLAAELGSKPHWAEDVVGLMLSSVQSEDQLRGFEFFVNEAVLHLEPQTLSIVRATLAHTHPTLVRVSLTLISAYGARLVDSLFSELQTGLERGSTHQRLGAVILLGALAQFLPTTDLKIDSSIDMLFSALTHDDESILKPIATSLPRLISYRLDQVPQLLEQQQERLYSKLSLAARRGAAYGVAAIVKGGGLRSLVRFNCMERMERIINTRKSTPEERGGVLLLVEGLSAVLGRGLEPYLGELLPFVIENFSDTNLSVQADRSIKQVLSKLSAHGIKCMLPLLNVELEDSRWQTKVGAVEAMGRMAYSASRQLANCLPTIVPQVMNAFQDTQHQVIEAATRALNTIASVVTNPEVSNVVPQLIRALQDVSSLTAALKTLLATEFAHYLDAASLSLIVPIIETGLRSRDSEVKKLSCQVVGTLFRLLRSPEELEPYLPCIESAIRTPLLDSIPDVRFIAAQSLGSLCFGMKHLGKRIEDWLVKTMNNPGGSIERAGATHAYSELMLLSHTWEQQLERLFDKCLVPEPYIRESHLSLFIFIPNTAQEEFESYLVSFLPVVVENLSHPLEEVRKAAQRVMKVLISVYSADHLTGLLSPLEVSLFAVNWHTRLSGLQLISELLEIAESAFRRTGTRPISDEQHARVLAAVYVLRCDHASNIHTLAVQTWKNLVDNTPKTLGVLTPQIVMHLLTIAQNPEQELQEIASKSVESLVYKYQDRVFSHYLTFFKDFLHSHPRGVAVCLSTACKHASPQLLTQQSTSIMQILEPMLMGGDADLNNAGGVIFQLLYSKSSEFADPKFLNTLLDYVGPQISVYRQLLRKPSLSSVVSRVVPFIMKSSHKALILNEVASLIADDLFENRHLYTVFPNIVRSLAKGETELLECVKEVAGALTDIEYLTRCVEHLELMKDSPTVLEVVVQCLQNSPLNLSSLLLPLLQLILPHLNSPDQDVVSFMPVALRMLADRVPKEEHAFLLEPLYHVLEPLQSVPFFNFERGLDAVLSLLMNSLMYGRPEMKAIAAKSYRIVIELTNSQALSAYVVQMAGPLIRVMNERVSSDSKVNILQALRMLIVKGADKLKPFAPQLQSTFMKALQHNEAIVRVEAKEALLELFVLNPHIEMLVNDLLTFKGDLEVVIISLDTLEAILSRIDLPPALGQTSMSRLLRELPRANDYVTQLAAKVMLRLATPEQVLQQLQDTEEHIRFAKYYLPLLPTMDTAAAEYVAEAIDQHFSEGLSLLTELAGSHPSSAFKLTVKLGRRLCPLISECFSLLRTLPSEEFCRQVDSLADILPALAFALKLLMEEGSSTEEIDQVIIHIFRMRSSGMDNVLRALHLLAPEAQVGFRRHVEALST